MLEEALPGRRQVLIGLLAAIAAAACSSGDDNDPTAATEPDATTTTTLPIVTSATIPPADRIPDDVIASDAAAYNGVWDATWTHDDGTAGPVSAVVDIDPTSRTATLTIVLGAGFYGPDSEEVTDTTFWNLDDYAWDQTLFDGSSQILGSGTLERIDIGTGQIELKGTSIPEHLDIATITVRASRLNFIEPHPFTYEFTRSDGTVVTGSATFDQA